jgi:ArsR family transcriptional regulator
MTSSSFKFDAIVDLLRALAEPTRCRLLALLSHGELTVGEIAEVLGQSQPRISRHLKLLSDVAVLERFREEQRIYYRLTSGTESAELVSQMLSRLGATDSVLRADVKQLTIVRDQRVRSLSAQWADIRRCAEYTYSDDRLIKEITNVLFGKNDTESLGELLDIGTGSGSMLSVLGQRAKHAVGLDVSTHALRIARARVHGAGLNHCVFKRGDMYDLPFDQRSFDSVSFDHVLSIAEKPGQALKEAGRVLRKNGRVIVVEDIRRLTELGSEKPQSLMRYWFERAGLRCNKMKSIPAGNKTLLLGVATRQ